MEAAEEGLLGPSSLDAYVARNEGDRRHAAMMMAFSGTAALALLALAVVTDSQAVGLALAMPLIFFAYAFERWQDARGGRESLRRDVLAISNVLYQDPTLIGRVLEREMVHEYLQNLLKAALRDDDFGAGYWKQGVRPFLEHGERGFREDWRYCIDIAELAEPVRVPVAGSDEFVIEPGRFWALATVSSYRQHVKMPREAYYVGCTFSLESLPTWFRDEGFLLRELTHLDPEQTEALGDVYSDRWLDPTGAGGADQVARDAARAIFSCELRIAGVDLDPDGVQIGPLGIRWRYPVAAELHEALHRSVPVRIEMRTYQPRHQAFFPVNVTHPTRHPTVQFSYAQTPLAPSLVGANVFFSAEEPYRPELVEHQAEAKRIELNTHRDDWVFAGSGCMFVWRDPGADGAGGTDA